MLPFLECGIGTTLRTFILLALLSRWTSIASLFIFAVLTPPQPIHLTCPYGSLSISLNRSDDSTNQDKAEDPLRVLAGELTVGNI